MRHLFIIDPLPLLHVDKDTSIAFMREASRRGHEVFTAELGDLDVAPGGLPTGRVVPTSVTDDRHWYEAGAAVAMPLERFDAVWMRKDPPYDMSYFYATHLLELVSPPTRIINSPRGLREVTEKLFGLRFPALGPESLVTCRIDELLAFRDKIGGEMVVKPLDGAGGEGVFHLIAGDRNVRAILETATRHGTRYQIAQRYIPEIREGDKRIILLEGEPIGALLRVPAHGESRANLHVGGTAVRCAITERDREICAVLGPPLREHGILFAGIDVIGRWLTEVNVTSPTGIREINALEGVCLEAQVLDTVERLHHHPPQETP